MIALNTQLGLSPRAFWYVTLRSFVAALFTVLLGSLWQLLPTLPGASCNGHPCNPASGAHVAAFIYLFAAFLVVRGALNFKWFSFVVTDRNLTVTSGVLSRNTSTIRFDRIQDVNTRQNPLHALLGLKSIAIWTASPDQRVGSSRRPDGLIVLEAGDADWLRDYLSDPPAAAASSAGDRGASAPSAAPRRGNGAVAAAFVIAAGLVALAVLAASQSSPPAPSTPTAAAGATARTPASPAPGRERQRSHLHVARPQPGEAARATERAPAALPATAGQGLSGDYGIACALDPQRPVAGLRSCAELATAQRCAHEGDFPSKPTAEPAVLTLVNRSAESLRLYWLNPSGTRAPYATLPPGGHVDQQSHTGAHWLVAAADGHCVGVFDAATMKLGIF